MSWIRRKFARKESKKPGSMDMEEIGMASMPLLPSKDVHTESMDLLRYNQDDWEELPLLKETVME